MPLHVPDPWVGAGDGGGGGAGAAERAAGVLYRRERGGDALLCLTHQIVHIIGGDTAKLLGFGLGRGDHFRAALLGDANDLLLFDHDARLFLGALAQSLGLALGIADKLIPRSDETLCLGEGCGEIGLDVVDDLDGLFPFDDALVVAKRDAPGLGYHAIEDVEQFDYVVCVIHCFSPIVSLFLRSRRSAPAAQGR